MLSLISVGRGARATGVPTKSGKIDEFVIAYITCLILAGGYLILQNRIPQIVVPDLTDFQVPKILN